MLHRTRLATPKYGGGGGGGGGGVGTNTAWFFGGWTTASQTVVDKYAILTSTKTAMTALLTARGYSCAVGNVSKAVVNSDYAGGSYTKTSEERTYSGDARAAGTSTTGAHSFIQTGMCNNTDGYFASGFNGGTNTEKYTFSSSAVTAMTACSAGGGSYGGFAFSAPTFGYVNCLNTGKFVYASNTWTTANNAGFSDVTNGYAGSSSLATEGHSYGGYGNAAGITTHRKLTYASDSAFSTGTAMTSAIAIASAGNGPTKAVVARTYASGNQLDSIEHTYSGDTFVAGTNLTGGGAGRSGISDSHGGLT